MNASAGSKGENASVRADQPASSERITETKMKNFRLNSVNTVAEIT